jgi:hypothetical protein
MSQDEIISAFAFRAAKQIEDLIKTQTNNLTEQDQIMQAKVLQWYVKSGYDEEFAEHFGISRSRSGTTEMKTRLEKHKVCDQCYAAGMLHNDCICSYGKYNTIELEFHVCKCCGSLLDDGNPAETAFNEEQIKNHEPRNSHSNEKDQAARG